MEPASRPASDFDTTTTDLDILIIGGGIAGLWCLHRLAQLGYSVLLLEKDGLGAGQTNASQGVIHGGVKYTLTGKLTESSEELLDMPARWQKCLEGSGEIDLRGVPVLSQTQLLWSDGSASSRVMNFFASKMLTSRVHRIAKSDLKPPLDNSAYKGIVYEIDEFVLDIPATLEAFAKPFRDRILRYAQNDLTLTLTNPTSGPGEDSGVTVTANGVTLTARHAVLAAGEGNETLLAQAGLASEIRMQRRPLHQVLMKHPDLPPFYSVCLGSGPRPPLVCTTHYGADRVPVWYLGGQLAETGVDRTESGQIDFARAELHRLLPWLDPITVSADWATLQIDRAEGLTADGQKPPGVFVHTRGPVTTVWPTKLALAPKSADQVCATIQARNLPPSAPSPAPAPSSLEQAAVARPAWDTLF